MAAPTIITVAVVAATLWKAMTSDGAGKREPTATGSPRESAPAARPPASGWYIVNPVTDPPFGGCLSVLPDDRLQPTLAFQDRCSLEDRLQRIGLVALGNGHYLVKAMTAEDKVWCTTLDAPVNGARLHLRPCAKTEPRQRFAIEATGRSSERGPLFRLSPAATRGNGMCVGIDPSHPGTVQTVHTDCGRTGVLGYSLTPVSAPSTS